jgi:hypothetical protein
MPAIIAIIFTSLMTVVTTIFGIFTPISIFLGSLLSAIGGIFTGIGALFTTGLTAIGGIFTSLTTFIGQTLTFLNPWFMLMSAIQIAHDFFTFLLSMGSSQT